MKILAVLSMLLKYSLCVIGIFVVLPFGGADGVRFERVAHEWSQGGLLDVLTTFDVTRSYLISSITAVFYNLLGRDPAIPIFINGIMGIAIFYLALRIAQEVWDERKVNLTFAFIVGFHPMLNVNSAIVLRENYILLFALCAVLQLVRYSRNGKLSSAIAFLIFTLISSFFHGGMLLLACGLPLFVLLSSANINRTKKMVVGGLFVAVLAIIISFVEFGKLSDLQQGEVLDIEYLVELEAGRQEANTAYLVGLAPSSPIDLVWQAPVRVIYLLTKPFPWDVRSFGQVIVLLDATLWWLIIFLAYRNWRVIKSNPAALAVLLSCVFAVLAFSYGTSNWGTGFRHRTKFLVMALVLVYPFLPRFRFSPDSPLARRNQMSLRS